LVGGRQAGIGDLLLVESGVLQTHVHEGLIGDDAAADAGIGGGVFVELLSVKNGGGIDAREAEYCYIILFPPCSDAVMYQKAR
jgi:hypothetical protein